MPTDRSIARQHADWLSLIEVSGPFLSMPVLLESFPHGLDVTERDPEMRRRLRLAYEEWLDNQEGTRPEQAIHTQWLRFVLEEVLEFRPDTLLEGQALPPELCYEVKEHGETLRPQIAVRSPYESKARLLVQLYPKSQGLERVVAGKRWPTSPATRMMELLRNTSTRLGLVTNGEQWMLIDAPPNETTGYYSWYSALWLEEPLTLLAFRSLLGMERFFNVPDDETLTALLTRSALKQQEVTDQLGDQVRRAVDTLVRTLDRLDKDSQRTLLRSITEKELYEAALTVMMRLVFLLSAEERGMLLLGEPLYDQNYAVSSLLKQLREQADQHGEEVLGLRYDAWSRLLATFRMVYGGVEYPDLRLPAYGGHLFDPDRFPFLEGRPPDTSWRDTHARPLAIDNRTVLHLLNALQYLQVKVPGSTSEPRRLSFRGLDIEQIGHVYEGLLDHTAKKASETILGLTGTGDSEPEATLEELERHARKGEEALLAFLHETTNRSPLALRKNLSHPPAPVGTRLSASDLSPVSPENSPTIPSPRGPLPGDALLGGTLSSGNGIERVRFSAGGQGGDKSDALKRVPTGQGTTAQGATGQGGDKSDALKRVPTGAGRASAPVSTLEQQERSRLMEACDNRQDLFERILPFAGLLRKDTFKNYVIVTPGSVYVTRGSDRRSTGTHYTPRSLTEPIVQHALDPLVYLGPADGLPQEQWQLRSAAEILELKVCDIAMGSGAFLVQSCRYLSEKLVEVWDNAERALNHGNSDQKKPQITPAGQLSQGRPGEELLPIDIEERKALARRLIAERCLYGVDKNPMAVEMAKLSLWLITLAKNRPFTFVDHALRCGDSLLGADERQLHNGSLEAKSGEVSQMSQIRFAMQYVLPTVIEKRQQIATLVDHDVHDIEIKERLLKEADQALQIVKLGADLLIAIALSDPKRRANLQDTLGMNYVVLAKAYDEALHAGNTAAGWIAKNEAFAKMRAEVDELLQGRRPFHWPLEFPEVFVAKGDDAGFSAIVSNPPFQGGKKITGTLGTDYRDYIVEYIANGKNGSADLCAYFFLQATKLVRHNGMAALLATNTIAQGDTREVGLDQIVAAGWSIPRAISSCKWLGEANLEVAYIWLWSGEWNGEYILDRTVTAKITSHLTASGAAHGKPFTLSANMDKSFIGSVINGIGFVLSKEVVDAFLLKNPKNRDVLFPYLNADDVNSRPDQSPSRWIINFHDWPLEKAELYNDCMEIVVDKVKPQRLNLNRKAYRERWWQYAEKCLTLYQAISHLKKVLVIPRVSKYMVCAWASVGIVYSDATVVIASESNALFALIQCTFHGDWTRVNGSSMRNDQRYTPTDCFQSFPFPKNIESLDNIGMHYHTHRQSIMLTCQEGLTQTYNRFHDPKEQAADIVQLRALHKEMDEAVARAYGWDELRLEHGFHETKQGLRYTISEAARREALDRLLLLNHQRHEEEVQAGLFEAGAKGKKGKTKGRKSESKDEGKAKGKSGAVGKAGRVLREHAEVYAVERDVQQERLF